MHQTEKSHDDVIVFWSQGKIKNFFPQNIKNFFKNAQKIYFSSANISTLSKYDLQPFGSQLTGFWFHDNNFEAIESDLFEFTPNIDYIHLDQNKIKFVGSGAFSSLKNLKKLYFYGNPCHSIGSATDRLSVINLITTIESKCTDLQALERQRILTINTTIRELKSDILRLKNDHKQQIDEHTAQHDAENIKNKNKLEKLQKDNEKLKQEIEVYMKINDRTKKDELKKFSENLMQKFIQLNSKMIEKFDDKIESKFKLPDKRLTAIDLKLDSCGEHLNSINVTCTALDLKIEDLNKNCEHFSRNP